MPKVADQNYILYYLLIREREIDINVFKKCIKLSVILISFAITSIKPYIFEGWSSIEI